MLDFLIGNDFLSAILAFGIVLIPAVIVHELGHFFAARAVGITVLEFGIGFPPRIAKLFTWRETEFTLNAIPLGGFVRPLGEDMVRPLSEEETERERDKLIAARNERAEENYISERDELAARGFSDVKAVYDVKPWPRIFFLAAGAIANFVFAFLVFVMIGLIGLQQPVGARLGVANIAEDSPLAQSGLQQQDIIERVNGEYFASADDLADLLQSSIGDTVTLLITRPVGEASTEMLTLEIVPTEAMIAQIRAPQPFVLITNISENSPAIESGLQAGDYITAFNAEQLRAENPTEDLVQKTNEQAGNEVILTILREGEVLDIAVTPRQNPPPGDGRIGISISGQFVSSDGSFGYVEATQFEVTAQPIGPSVNYATERILSVFQLIAEFPARLLQGTAEPEERRIVSVVGISQLGGVILQDSIQESQITPLLEYVALISIALGFTNLLPIPALDGGRIMFVILELIRGKPIPPEREGVVHLVGVIFILSIGVFFIINDFMNPLTDWIR